MNGMRRLLERELIAGLGARRRRALIERLRGNAAQRRGWDRAIAAFRVLERREVSRFEVDQVERWLFEDLGEQGVLASVRPRFRWAWLGGVAATLLSAAALLMWIDSDPAVDGASVEHDELVPRGGDRFARPLAIELMCGQPVRSAATRGCSIDETLGFSLRLGADGLAPETASALGRAPLHVSAFGLAEDGSLLYYLPTPDEPASATAKLGAPWRSLPFSVRLSINHAPGRVRVFALASERPADVAEIEQLADALRPQPIATIDDPPWHLRLPDAALASLCPQPLRCASAETVLTITPDDIEEQP